MKMKKFILWLDEHLEEALLVLLLIAIAAVGFIQVVVRNLPWIPALKWAEEFCRFAWIWSVFLSLPYTIKKANMLRVSLLADMLPPKARAALSLLADALTTAIMGFLCLYSVPVVRRVMLSGELSPAMELPMWAVYSVVFVGFLFAFLRGVQSLWAKLRAMKGGAE